MFSKISGKEKYRNNIIGPLVNPRLRGQSYVEAARSSNDYERATKVFIDK